MTNPTPMPLLAYLGHHRSGSTWLFRVFRELVVDQLGWKMLHAPGAGAFQGDLAAAQRRDGFRFMALVNADFDSLRGTPLRAVHVVRDPRDLLISAYFAHALSHPTDNWPELAAFRSLLASVDQPTGLLLELEFCANVFDAMASFPPAVEGILEVRYETLIEEPWREFERMFEHLGFDRLVSRDALEDLVHRHRFEALSGGRGRGESDPSNHYRKGVAGDWRAEMPPAVRWAFESRFGSLLRRYGYETSGEWAGTEAR
ncbi:MAG: sulfotransferase domain-containing protein [Thermoanaerobaculia bacterium]